MSLFGANNGIHHIPSLNLDDRRSRTLFGLHFQESLRSAIECCKPLQVIHLHHLLDCVLMYLSLTKDLAVRAKRGDIPRR